MLRFEIGLGIFSSLVVVVVGCPWAGTPCTACVCVLRRVTIRSQVGTRGAVLNPQPPTEHSNGVGGAMMIEDVL